MRADLPDQRIYAELGRFVVTFSQMEHTMSAALHSALALGATNRSSTTGSILLSGLTADRVREAFFATCASMTSLSDVEKQILSRLQGDVQTLIRQRNEVMHATWFVSQEADEELARAMTLYARASTKAPQGLKRSDGPWTAERLADLSDDATRLLHLLWSFYTGCSAPERLGRVELRFAIAGDTVIENPEFPDNFSTAQM